MAIDSFEAAVAAVQEMDADPGNDTKLRVYALYKQATEGDVQGSRPGFTNLVGRAKYDAWAKAKGTDAESAPLYDQAVDIVLKNQRASISLVQRHLRIGYNRSARLIEAMEKAGLVSGMDGRGGREVLMKKPAE